MSALGRFFVAKVAAERSESKTLPVEARDVCTRECLALVADTSIPGLRVARELNRIVAGRGRPVAIVSDNGTELATSALRWMK